MWGAITVPGGFDAHAIPPIMSIKPNTYIRKTPNISQHMYWDVLGKPLRFSQTLTKIHNNEHERNQFFQSNLKNSNFYFPSPFFYELLSFFKIQKNHPRHRYTARFLLYILHFSILEHPR